MDGILGGIATYIINPVIVLGFVIATIFLFWNVIQLMWNSDGKDPESQKTSLMYSVLGLFIMVSVYGILQIVLATFNIPCEQTIFFCKP